MTYSYNSRSQLISAGLSSSIAWVYKYDGENRRIEKSSDTSTRGALRYIYDAEKLLAMLDESNSPRIIFTNGPDIDELLWIHRSDADYSIHSDVQGSVKAHLNSSGVIAERFAYSAFGTPVIVDLRTGTRTFETASFAGSPISYAGRDIDTETGFINMRLRQTYDANTGRFFQTDPMMRRWSRGENLYVYVLNNPILTTDPYGASPAINRSEELTSPRETRPS